MLESPQVFDRRQHLRDIKLSLCLHIGNDFLVHGSVTTIRNETFGVFKLVVLVPHLSTVTNHNRHGGINNDIGRNVLKVTGTKP